MKVFVPLFHAVAIVHYQHTEEEEENDDEDERNKENGCLHQKPYRSFCSFVEFRFNAATELSGKLFIVHY